ncbi:MAG: hypothetical protein O3C10_13750 [Chloroflexi bacterium]|nr:hypothetical protein [Chloroflexota bacterium]
MAIVLAVSIVTVSSYASATEATNTLTIVPLFAPGGPGGGGAAAVMTEVGEDFKSNPKHGKNVKGRVLTQINMPPGIGNANLVIDLLWTNSIEVTGPLAKSNAFLRTGLYFADTDQRKAKDNSYAGDCDDRSQREFKLANVKTYVCPDTTSTAQQNLSQYLANGILASSVNGHSTLFLLADIPKVPNPPGDDGDDDEGDGNDDDDDDGDPEEEEPGSESPGQIKKLDFHISLIAI